VSSLRDGSIMRALTDVNLLSALLHGQLHARTDLAINVVCPLNIQNAEAGYERRTPKHWRT